MEGRGKKGTLASRAELTERGLHQYEGFNICTNCHDSIFRSLRYLVNHEHESITTLHLKTCAKVHLETFFRVNSTEKVNSTYIRITTSRNRTYGPGEGGETLEQKKAR